MDDTLARLPRAFAGKAVLVLGDVTGIHLSDAAEPESLVYHNRGYGRFSRAKT